MSEIYFTKYLSLPDPNPREINKFIINTTNEVLYDMIYQQPTLSNNFYNYFGTIDAGEGNEIFRYFYTLKTNPYIVRKSTVNSIIAFYSGKYFGYGDTLNDDDEIDTMLKLFIEVREYFYKMLFNNAFLKTDLYDLFIKFYLKSYTIERFMTSKIDNLHNIDKYSLEDCKNFFISYGLSDLQDQIDKANFSMALTYCRRIVAKYTDLMSKKGSRAVIDEFIKIFDFDTTDIDIFKYLLIKVTPDLSNKDKDKLKFIRTPYQTENIIYSLEQNKNNITPYDDFIADDKYWDGNDVPEDVVKEKVSGPVTTKYLGIKLTKKIYEDYVKSKYAISAMYEIYKAIDKLPDAIKNDIKKNLTIQIDSDTYSLLELYLKTLVVYDRYTELQEKTFDENEYSVNTKKKYYRINMDINKMKNFINMNSLKDIMSTPILCKATTESVDNTGIGGGTATIKYSECFNDFYYYVKSKNLLPFLKLKKDDDPDGNRIINIGSKLLLPNTYIAFPLSMYIGGVDITYKNYMEFCINYNNKSVSDRKSSLYNDYDKIPETYKSHTLLDDALTSISILNALQYKKSDADIDPTIHKNLFIAMLYFEALKNEDSSYQSNSDLRSDVGINTYLYNSLFKGIFDFPVKYLLGKYKHGNIELTKNTVDLLDKIFDEFFTADDSLVESENIEVSGGSDGNGQYLKRDVYYRYTLVENPIADNIGDYYIKTDSNQYEQQVSGSSIDSNKKYYIRHEIPIYNRIDNIDEYQYTIYKNKLIDAAFPSINDNDFQAIYSDSSVTGSDLDIKNAIEKCEELLVKYLTAINEIISVYDDMKVKIDFLEDSNNMLEFIKISIKNFISYTSLLYKSELAYMIDTENEHCHITDSIKSDTIQDDSAEDYCYVDETINIKDIT